MEDGPEPPPILLKSYAQNNWDSDKSFWHTFFGIVKSDDDDVTIQNSDDDNGDGCGQKGELKSTVPRKLAWVINCDRSQSPDGTFTF